MSQPELLTAGFKSVELEEGLAYMELMAKKKGACGAPPDLVETAAELVMPAQAFLKMYVEMENIYNKIEQQNANSNAQEGENG